MTPESQPSESVQPNVVASFSATLAAAIQEDLVARNITVYSDDQFFTIIQSLYISKGEGIFDPLDTNDMMVRAFVIADAVESVDRP